MLIPVNISIKLGLRIQLINNNPFLNSTPQQKRLTPTLSALPKNIHGLVNLLNEIMLSAFNMLIFFDFLEWAKGSNKGYSQYCSEPKF